MPDETHTGAQFRVIAEVTPRLRVLMQKRGVDWSTAALRRSIKGRWVELAGWLTYDVEHEVAAYANDPDDVIGQHNWRATVWEVHPITYLKVIDRGEHHSLASIVNEQGGIVKKAAGGAPQTASGRFSWWWLILVVLVLIAGFLLWKKSMR